jgi:hypothetical protein
MKRFLFAVVALACLALGLPAVAEAHFVDGFLADCSAVTATTCTELTGTGYARQPIFFNSPTKGIASLGTPYYFPASVGGTIAGRAVYDAPTGGNLLFIMPLATPFVIPSNGDTGDVGSIKVTFTAFVPFQYGETFIGTAASGATLGTTSDGSTVTSGHTLTFLRGLLLPGTLAPT